MCGLRSKIFRQVVQKFCRLADASQGIFVQHDGNSFKQGVHLNLCGVALIITFIMLGIEIIMKKVIAISLSVFVIILVRACRIKGSFIHTFG